jgi:hypothetical protein
MIMNDHLSNSAIQQSAEIELLQILSQKLGCRLVPHNIRLNKKSAIQIDGFSLTGRILCEVYAHVGILRGSQPDKVAADILKLNLAANRLGGQWRKILLFADEAACKQVKGSSWLAEACKDGRVEIEVAETSATTREKIAVTQRRQKMVNAE